VNVELVVIADEITAVGWRLAGARVQTPAQESMSECFREALDNADLVVITQEMASRLSSAELEAALDASEPPLLIITDLRHTQAPPDLEKAARHALGVNL
jgi:vacuolar-type H+-ATPase subunit F/Vma7